MYTYTLPDSRYANFIAIFCLFKLLSYLEPKITQKAEVFIKVLETCQICTHEAEGFVWSGAPCTTPLTFGVVYEDAEVLLDLVLVAGEVEPARS